MPGFFVSKAQLLDFHFLITSLHYMSYVFTLTPCFVVNTDHPKFLSKAFACTKGGSFRLIAKAHIYAWLLSGIAGTRLANLIYSAYLISERKMVKVTLIIEKEEIYPWYI